MQTKNRRIFSFIFSAVTLLVVTAIILGGSLLASRAWDPSWNPFKDNPKKDMSKNPVHRFFKNITN